MNNRHSRYGAPQAGTRRHLSMGKGRSSTDCGIGVMRGTELRKGLPFTSPALCTEDAEGGEDMHYLFRTKHPKTASLTAGCTRGASDIAIVIVIAALDLSSMPCQCLPWLIWERLTLPTTGANEDFTSLLLRIRGNVLSFSSL